MIKKHGLIFIVIRALARRLQRQADFLFRLIGEEERVMPAQVRISGSLAAHEQPALSQATPEEPSLLSHATPEEPPVDWLAQTEAGDVPPADWLARVRQGQSQGQSQGQGQHSQGQGQHSQGQGQHSQGQGQQSQGQGQHSQGQSQQSQRQALALHTGDRGGKLPSFQTPILGRTDDVSYAANESTSSLHQIKSVDDVFHAANKAASFLHHIKNTDDVSYAAIESTSSLHHIKNTDNMSHTAVESTSSLTHIKQADGMPHTAVKATSSFVHMPDTCEIPYLAIKPASSFTQTNEACGISYTPIPSTSFLRFHQPLEDEGSTTNGASYPSYPNVEAEPASDSVLGHGASYPSHPNVEAELASASTFGFGSQVVGSLSAPTTHQESVLMNITSKRSWSAIRQPFAPVVQPTQGVNNQHLVPALEHKRLHRPATVPTSEPGTPVSSVLPLLPTHARQNHTHVSDSVALNNPYGRLTDALPDAYFLDHAPTHPQTSWPHLGHAFSLPTLPSGTVASDAMFSGSISPDHWPSLPPEPAHLHPHVEPELASSLTPASGSPASSIFSSSTAWAHRQRLNNEQRGGTWSE